MFLYSFYVDGHRTVLFFTIMSKAVKTNLLKVFLWICAFILLGQISESRIIES